LRLGLLIFALQMLVWIVHRALRAQPGLVRTLYAGRQRSGFPRAVVFYIVYLAIEPYIRRHWPHAIISWTRLMAGRIRDPLVGRDVLFGVILGLGWSLIFAVLFAGLKHIGAEPDFPSTEFLLGPRMVLRSCLTHAALSVQVR
jgi:hypothetical protein